MILVIFFTITEIGAAEPKKEVETNASSVSASLLLFQTRCRFDYAVLRARSPRQVITPGDGGAE
jgi:hypothetical protein